MQKQNPNVNKYSGLPLASGEMLLPEVAPESLVRALNDISDSFGRKEFPSSKSFGELLSEVARASKLRMQLIDSLNDRNQLVWYTGELKRQLAKQIKANERYEKHFRHVQYICMGLLALALYLLYTVAGMVK